MNASPLDQRPAGAPLHYIVALSGGVDSSTAAALLLQEGHRVTAVTLGILNAPGCDHLRLRQNLADAACVAGVLGVAHRVVDISREFTEEVVAPFVQEYAAGRTPNPCVRCNRLIKFKVMLDIAAELGADAVASGHYAQIARDDAGRCHLHRGIDDSRDQSYFLYNLTQAQLQRIRFPLGGWTKKDVRALATRLGLPRVEKDESRGICFVPDEDYGAFVRTHFPHTLRPGQVTDMHGTRLADHEGVQFYTIGQRKGVGAHGARKFVVRIDGPTGTVVIGDNSDLIRAEMLLDHLNWIVPPPAPQFSAAVKIRSTSPLAPCDVFSLPDDRVRVVFHTPERAVTPGQAGVIYLGDEAVGGGSIV